MTSNEASVVSIHDGYFITRTRTTTIGGGRTVFYIYRRGQSTLVPSTTVEVLHSNSEALRGAQVHWSSLPGAVSPWLARATAETLILAAQEAEILDAASPTIKEQRSP